MIVCHQHDRVGGWVMSRCNNEWFPGKGTTMGFSNSNHTLVAGCVFEQYNGTHMFLHCAARRGSFFSKEFLHACFHYCFVANSCKRISCVVDSSNTRCQKFVAGVGWEEDVRLKGAGIGNGDLIVYKMTPQTCKWLTEDERNGR
jgi:RimJ/RimL family protein N-acetyltransferase